MKVENTDVSDFLLASHFTDSAELSRCTRVDKFNSRIFAPSETIKCRKVKKVSILKGSDDESIQSTVSIYTFNKVDDLDRIDGQDIKAITEWKSLLTNEIVGYIIRI